MTDLVLKYLVIKMHIGYGYSITDNELEQLLRYLHVNGIKIKESPICSRFVERSDGEVKANYSLNADVLDISKIDEASYNLLCKFIKKHASKDDLKRQDIDDYSLQRSKELSACFCEDLYTIRANTGIRKLKDMKHYNLEEIEEVPAALRKLYSLFSQRIAYLLSKDEHLVVTNKYRSQIDSKLGYRAIYNDLFVSDKLRSILSIYSRGEKFAYFFDFNNTDQNNINQHASFVDLYLTINQGSESDNTVPYCFPRTENPDLAILDSNRKEIEIIGQKIKKLESGSRTWEYQSQKMSHKTKK